ncbi:uncharacterized protein LOC103317736 isoform X2 [Nasonia vitripennis]|uniref:Uncharacterized protein n=1 Tax=Nasonia vitripennis TaxID=7425 RepID=A0A7M7QVK6_NASVI|nr:uncharacterized protein LOC103317736 isoform X2 [Nasonia vitripennis]
MCSSCRRDADDARINDGCCGGKARRQQGCCLDRPYDCTGTRPRGPSGRGKCRCELEESWNKCTPPRPHRDWPGNFGELRRRWSEHVKRQSCPCDDCRKKSILPLTYNDTVETSPNTDCEDESDDCQRRHTSNNYKCPASSRFSSSRHSSASAKNTSGRCDADNGCCLCQAARRDCCCPSPVQVDARSHENCSCECPEPVECPCSPAERRFPRPGRRCTVADSCPVNRARHERRKCRSRTSSDSEDRRRVNSRQEKHEQPKIQKCRKNTPYEPKHQNSNRSSCCSAKATSHCPNLPGFPRCYFDQPSILHATPCRSPTLSTAPLLSRLCRDNNSSRVCCQRQLTIRRWRRGTSCCRSYGYRRHSLSDVEDEDSSCTSGKSSDWDCRPIVYERGELLIIEDTKDLVAARVDDNEAASAEDESTGSLREQPSSPHHPLPSPLRNFDSHAENCANRPLNHASKRRSDETIFFDVDVLVTEESSLSLRFCGEEGKNEPEKMAPAYGELEEKISGAKRTNQLFEELNNSGSKCRGNEESHRKSVNKQISRMDRPDRISTIDLHCSKFTIGYPEDKKTKKPERCPATCRYFVGSQKAASDDHQRVLSNRKKSRRRV